MKSFTEGQERVFEIIDRIIDDADPKDNTPIESKITRNIALRSRIKKNFKAENGLNSTQVALRDYGFVSYGSNLIPNELELRRCWYIDSEFKVKADDEYITRLADLYHSDSSKIRSMANQFKKELQLDALSEFVRSRDADDLHYESYRHISHIRTFVEREFKTHANFRRAFSINQRLFPMYSRSELGFYTNMGHRFERLIERAFIQANANVDCSYKVDGCWPDFVIEDVWLDAKLSKSTAFNGSETIEKYTKHTDYLTLIYAIEDMPDDDLPELIEGVELIHVFDYFPDLPEDLKNEFTTLIDEVTRRKRGERT